MINEFFCWLLGHQSFSGALGTKIYKRQGRRFVYTGIDLYLCKCCNKLFVKPDKKRMIKKSSLSEVLNKDVPPMPGRSGLIG